MHGLAQFLTIGEDDHHGQIDDKLVRSRSACDPYGTHHIALSPRLPTQEEDQRRALP